MEDKTRPSPSGRKLQGRFEERKMRFGGEDLGPEGG